MELTDAKLKSIVSNFSLKGDVVSIKPYGNGHINRTFLVTTTSRKYILQKINSNVFTNVDNLMSNIIRVTEHLLDKGVFTLKFRPTYDARLYYKEEDEYFRMYKLIDDTYCYEGIDNLDVVRKSGLAFGQLHGNLADLNPANIVDVIPDFHNTEKRYKNLLKSIANDPVGRVKEVKDVIAFINEHKNDYSLLMNGLRDGTINNAITHNDPKINNILFDKTTLDVKCVIDLDTVMTGTYLFDFGDALRSLFTGENEDSKDLSKLKVNFDMYRAYLEGYYSQMVGVLNKREIELLPMAVVIITMELAIRFLTDYIDGDIYFGIKYPEHNLDRAMTQITLAKDLYKNLDKLNEITREICK